MPISSKRGGGSPSSPTSGQTRSQVQALIGAAINTEKSAREKRDNDNARAIATEKTAREAQAKILVGRIDALRDSNRPFLYVAPYHWERGTQARKYTLVIGDVITLDTDFEDVDKIRVLVAGQPVISSMDWTLATGARVLDITVNAATSENIDNNITDPNDPVAVEVEFYATGGAAITSSNFAVRLRARVPVIPAIVAPGVKTRFEQTLAASPVTLQEGTHTINVLGSESTRRYTGQILVSDLPAADATFIFTDNRTDQATSQTGRKMIVTARYNAATRALNWSNGGDSSLVLTLKAIGEA